MTPLTRATKRQRQLLEAYVETGSHKRAAERLGITEHTARLHMTGLLQRTGAANSAQAAFWLGLASKAKQRVA